MVSDCSIFHVRPGQTSLPPADHLLPPQTASCQLSMQCLETPTLAHINSLLNAATLWLRLTLRGTLHPCLLCGAGRCDELHQPPPLFAGVHTDRVHIGWK